MHGRKLRDIMIYNHNLFTKEQKQAFIEKKESRNKILFYGIIVALLTFSLHFMLQTLTRSVLPSAVPQLMMPSYFSTLSLYIMMAFILYTAYMIRYYDFLTFAEISQNKWYTLAKNGYDPLRMIIIKLITRLGEVLTYYTIGFVSIIFLTMFLKYPFVVNYMISLYIVGLIDVIFLSIVTMSCSLFIAQQKNARYVIILSAVCIWLLRVFTGYYHLTSDRVWMGDVFHLYDFTQSSYLVYFLIMVVICLVVVLLRAQYIAQYTNFPFYEKDMDMGDDVKIVVIKDDTYEEVKDHYVKKKRRKGMDKLVNITMILFITAGVFINIFVLFVSLSSPERETNFFGVIPFVFHTESMEPEIMYNDLAFFDVIGKKEPLKAGQTILYHNDDGPQVAKIGKVEKDILSVDILKYSDDVEKGSYRKQIKRDSIYGRYSGRSRWLGAIILFANTVLGRLILLLVPAFMLYYYKPILEYLRRKGLISD